MFRRRRTFIQEFASGADPHRIFALLSDAPTWPSWFPPARRVRWLEGRPAGGAGAVRLVTVGPLTVRERVVAEVADSHHAYALGRPMPVRDHRADVWLSNSGGRTLIRWESAFTPIIPGSGRLLEWGLRLGLRQLAAALIRAAETG